MKASRKTLRQIELKIRHAMVNDQITKTSKLGQSPTLSEKSESSSPR